MGIEEGMEKGGMLVARVLWLFKPVASLKRPMVD